VSTALFSSTTTNPGCIHTLGWLAASVVSWVVGLSTSHTHWRALNEQLAASVASGEEDLP